MQAEIIALNGLAFLAASEEDMPRFVRLTGVDYDSLTANADNPEVLTAVLDFLLADDKLLLAFCEENDIAPKEVHLARRQLSGPA